MLSKFFGRSSRPESSTGEASPPEATAAATPAVENELLGARWAPAPAASRPAEAPVTAFEKTIPAALDTSRLDPKTRTLEDRKNDALAVVDGHHHRIANTIRTMWGYPECSVYINKLILAGGDGFGNNRVGFSAEAVQAMLELADLHDQEFGAPDLDNSLGMGPLNPRR